MLAESIPNDIALVTTKQLAEYLHLCPASVRKMVRDGVFPYYTVRKRWRFNLQEVMAALARGPSDVPLTKQVGNNLVEVNENEENESESDEESGFDPSGREESLPDFRPFNHDGEGLSDEDDPAPAKLPRRRSGSRRVSKS